MRPLLLDQNLSPRLASHLADLYPNSVHVFTVGLSTAVDAEIWEYARANDLIIVTKDADFSELGLLRGFPPKVIWICRGSCSTAEMEGLLRESFDAVRAMNDDPGTGILMLY